MNDGVVDIIVGRRLFSDYDSLVSDWRSAVGDQIRKEYLPAMILMNSAMTAAQSRADAPKDAPKKEAFIRPIVAGVGTQRTIADRYACITNCYACPDRG